MSRAVKLIKVEANANNNKYYNMVENGSEIVATWGRVGGHESTTIYPIYKWNSIYNSKIKKGYKDVSELVSISKKEFEINIKDVKTKTFVSTLVSDSKNVVKQNYLSSEATQLQIDEAQRIINELVKTKIITDINDKLVELYTVIPRKMRSVKDHLINDVKQLNPIITSEQDLLDNMVVGVKTNSVESLDLLGLEVIPITLEEEKMIRKHLGANANQFVEGFKVINANTSKKYNDFVSKVKNQKQELFWHGSRNENWWSIINSGLLLRPSNAVITGKMFGYGTYFADKAQKSIGYTSQRGSYWAKGNNNYGILSLYDVHVGNQYKTRDHNHSFYDFNETKLKSQGDYDSLFAEAGKVLMNNEYIVYNENQTNIQYIVKIS